MHEQDFSFGMGVRDLIRDLVLKLVVNDLPLNECEVFGVGGENFSVIIEMGAVVFIRH